MGTGHGAPSSGGGCEGGPFPPRTDDDAGPAPDVGSVNNAHTTNTTTPSRSTVELVYHTSCPSLNEFDKDHAESRAQNTNHESSGTATAPRRSAALFAGTWGATGEM